MEPEYVLSEVDDGLRTHAGGDVADLDAETVLFRLLPVLRKYIRSEVIGFLPSPASGQQPLSTSMRSGDLEFECRGDGVRLRHVGEHGRGLLETAPIEHGRVDLPLNQRDELLHVIIVPITVIAPYR